MLYELGHFREIKYIAVSPLADSRQAVSRGKVYTEILPSVASLAASHLPGCCCMEQLLQERRYLSVTPRRRSAGEEKVLCGRTSYTPTQQTIGGYPVSYPEHPSPALLRLRSIDSNVLKSNSKALSPESVIVRAGQGNSLFADK